MRLKIALSGKMVSGKSTVAIAFAREYRYKVFSIGSEIKPLMQSLIDKRERFEEKMADVVRDDRLLEKILNEVYAYYDQHFQNATWKKNRLNEYEKTNSYRRLLQEVPMIIRRFLGHDIFLRMLLERNPEILDDRTKVLIDDLRLPEEKRLLENHGFLIVRFMSSDEERLIRLKSKYGHIDPAALNHTTEVALDNENFDVWIETDGKDISTIVWELGYYVHKMCKKRDLHIVSAG